MIDVLQTILLVFVAGLAWHHHKPIKPLHAKTKRQVVLDTCALIDGRVVELAHAGFVPEELVIPEFVLHELQLLADGTDPHKRDRARYGLDVVQELQDSRTCTVNIERSSMSHKTEVDDKLIALAKKLRAPLYTTDFNLGKVAQIDGVKVLNVNELAQHLRPDALPGEQKTVKIIQKGSNPKQGVGYLQDGTMLVVEQGANLVGKTVNVEITRVHQTASGKMLFGSLIRKPSKPISSRTVRTPIPSVKTNPIIARMKRRRTQLKT